MHKISKKIIFEVCQRDIYHALKKRHNMTSIQSLSTRKHILILVNHYLFFSMEKSFTFIGSFFGDDDCSPSKLFFPTPFDQDFEK